MKPHTVKEPLYKERNLQIIFGVALMVVLGVSSITPAFPEIANGLNISGNEVGLLITFYTLPGVLFTPVMGVLADRLGRKEVLVPSLLLFGIAGAACGLTHDFGTILVLRFFQGIGAASLAFLNITVIGDLYSGKERSEAVGYNESIISFSEAIYPFIGGSVAMFGWYYPFYLPIVAVPIGFMVLFYLKAPRPENDLRIKEYLRNAALSFKSLQVIGLFAAIILTFAIYYGVFHSFFPFFMKKFDASSSTIGLFMTLTFISTAITSTQLGRLVKFFSVRHLLMAGSALYCLSMLVLPMVPNMGMLLFPVIIYGIAQGINLPNLLALLTGLAPMEHRAAFLSINWVVVRFGQTIGPLLGGLAFGLWGINAVFYSGAILAIAMLAVVTLFIK
ncbi:MAG: MFS transporter [Archaeoglobaceae archaeon]